MSECACSKSELDVCRPIDVQVAMTEGRWQTYYPINAITSSAGVVEFSVPGTSNEVIDMNNCALYIRGKVKSNATTDLVAANKIFPANNLLHSMIRHIDLSINGQLVTRAGKDYAYKAMFLKLLQTDMPNGGDEEDVQLILEGFAMDPPGGGKTLEGDKKTPGGEMRQELIEESRSFELIGTPALDLFQCDRSLLMGCDMAIKIYFNEPKFYLIDNTVADASKLASATVVFEEVELRVRRVQLAPSFVNSILTEVQQRDAIYPFTRREILTFNIPQGSAQVTKENIFRGYLANRFFIAMVNADGYNGSLATNPFCFRDFGLKEISMCENGQYMSHNPLKLDLAEKSRGVVAYRHLLESVGAVGERALSIPITYDHFVKGNTIICFTRSPDLTHGMNQLPPQTASITLQMIFKAATTKAITVVVMAEYDSRIQITKDNNVITDYTI